MTVLTVALAVLAALPFTLLGLAKITGSAGMPERAGHLGFTPASYRRIGVLELCGAAGLLAGVAAPGLGVAAAIGLLALLATAIVVHLRNGDGAPVVALVSAALVVAYAAARLVTW